MQHRVPLLLIGSLHALMHAQAVDLEAGLTRAITNTLYQAPTRGEWTRAKALFQSTLQGPCVDAELRSDWAALGFEFQAVGTAEESLWLLSEPKGKESGKGWYLFRTNSALSIALEAPHARNDVHSGQIALRLFLEGQTRVLAVGTVTRYRADMAHLDDTFFQAFTLAFAQAYPTGWVVQLHGFDERKHPDLKADVVASAGTRWPEPWLPAWARRLQEATSRPVFAYPQDTWELGATLNAQGRALRQTSHCRFLHLEMSRALRERLTRDDTLCRAILHCLSATQPQ